MTDFPEEKEEHKEKEEGRVAGPAFTLPIEDTDLADIIDRRIAESEKFYKDKLHLEERRKLNEDFWRGKQLDESSFYEYQIPYKDNLIWQDEETRLAIIASRMPEIIITPADQTQAKNDHAKALERGLDIKLGVDQIRRLLKDGLRYHDLYFTACIKPRWDKNTNDYVFDLVRPQKMVFDHTATLPQDGFTADNMEFICEWIEGPVAQAIADFPNKKEEIFKEMGMVKGTSKQLNSKIRYQEVWFSFYGDDGKLYEGVCWKLKKLILGKQRNPYFDWEGYEKADEHGATNTLYRNHFDRPRKPYIFFTYQNIGQSAIDDTTAVEQSIPIQRIVNKRGRQITEIADRTVPKIVALADGITKEDLRRVTNDPDEHISLSENVQDVRAALMTIVAEGPNPTLFQDLILNRTQIDAKFATHSTTRGERVAQESGIARQVVREGDLASHDDTSRIVVERVLGEMANWAVQLMKLFYDKEHFVKNVGRDGEMVYVELKRDIIDDGIDVNVKSSSVDKAQRRSDAQTAAARRQIDPLSYWEDLDAPNPKERTKRLLAFLSGQMDAYAQITDLTSAQRKDVGDKEAEADIERLKEGEDFEPPTPTPKYLEFMINFVNAKDYKDLPQETKTRFKEFVTKLKETFQASLAPQETPPPAPGELPPTPPENPEGVV